MLVFATNFIKGATPECCAQVWTEKVAFETVSNIIVTKYLIPKADAIIIIINMN